MLTPSTPAPSSSTTTPATPETGADEARTATGSGEWDWAAVSWAVARQRSATRTGRRFMDPLGDACRQTCVPRREARIALIVAPARDIMPPFRPAFFALFFRRHT